MTTETQFAGKDIDSCFFTRVENTENKHQCNLCGLTYSQNLMKGYTNLRAHMDQCHKSNWCDILKSYLYLSSGKGTIDQFFTALDSDKAINIHS